MGRHGQQTLGGIAKEINVLLSVQKICSKGWVGREEEQGEMGNGSRYQKPSERMMSQLDTGLIYPDEVCFHRAAKSERTPREGGTPNTTCG